MSPLYAERRQCKYGFLSDYIRCVVVFPNQLEDGTWRQASSSYESGERERESVIMKQSLCSVFFSICKNKGKIKDVVVFVVSSHRLTMFSVSYKEAARAR